MIRFLLLDWNGVVVDDEEFHFRSLAGALATAGAEVTREVYWERYLVLDDRRAIARALADAGQEAPPETMDRLLREKWTRYEKMAGENPPFFPGAVEAIRAAAARIPVAVVSGARRAEIETALAAGGIRTLPRFIIAAEETHKGKPDSAPYLAALDRAREILPDLSPGEVLAVEDTPGGIRSARGAGLRVLAVATSYEAARLAEADGVLPNLSALDLDHPSLAE